MVPEPSLREQIAALAATFKKTRTRHVPTINSWMFRRAAPSAPMPAKTGMPPMPSGAAAPVDVSTASAASSTGREDLQEVSVEQESSLEEQTEQAMETEQEVTQDWRHYVTEDPQEAAEEVVEHRHAEEVEWQGRTWRSWADQHEEEHGEDDTGEDLQAAEVAPETEEPEEALMRPPRQLRQLPSTPLPVTAGEQHSCQATLQGGCRCAERRLRRSSGCLRRRRAAVATHGGVPGPCNSLG